MSDTTLPMSRPRMNTPMASTRLPFSRAMFMLPLTVRKLATSESGTYAPEGVATSNPCIRVSERSASSSRTATAKRRSPSQICVTDLPPSADSITSWMSATLSP